MSTRVTDPEARAAYAAGLRRLADVIETDPDCPYPQGPISLFIHSESNDVAVGTRLRRALGGGTWRKTESASNNYLVLEGMCAGMPVNLWLVRSAVCERVVVGVEEVSEILPAVTEADLRPEQVVFRRLGSPMLASDDVQV